VSAITDLPWNTIYYFADGVVVLIVLMLYNSTTSHPESSGRTPPVQEEKLSQTIKRIYKNNFPPFGGNVSVRNVGGRQGGVRGGSDTEQA